MYFINRFNLFMYVYNGKLIDNKPTVCAKLVKFRAALSVFNTQQITNSVFTDILTEFHAVTSHVGFIYAIVQNCSHALLKPV